MLSRFRKVELFHVMFLSLTAGLLLVMPTYGAASGASGGKALLDVTASGAGAAGRLTPTSDQVSVAPSKDSAHPGLVVTIQPGKEGYPGVNLKPEGGAWNLSNFGHVEARVVNTGKTSMSMNLRVDNGGDWHKNPWNAEGAWLKPGASRTIKVIFGYSYGHKPGYKLNPSKVIRVMLFTGKVKKQPASFRIEWLKAAGPAGEKPAVKPQNVRTAPKGGVLLGQGVTIDAAKQIKAHDGAKAVVADGGLKLTFSPKRKKQSIVYTPPIGRWDLRQYLEVRVKLHNAGQSPVTPRVCVTSNGGSSSWIAAKTPLAPGAAGDVVVPFINPTIWDGQKKTGDQVTNDAVSGIAFAVEDSEHSSVLVVDSIIADLPTVQLPDWLGKRPPVKGDWVKTFDEEFNGKTIDAAKWNIYGHNYWDKKSHFSKDNVIVGDGVAKLRFSKKRGHQNDDPKNKKVTDYATGYLDTYGKWTQRYGYFEARVKLTSAPGLWPAFWMMPDRGKDAGPQWKRQDTANGGMEFDIMEHLDRWGPYRYNIAMHWDGYGKHHKATGSSKVYVLPDKDGFITVGLLWKPGLAVYYCNGQPVLRWENPRVSQIPSNLMFTLPMGGWDNNALDDAKLPDDFVIDYVRCWQLKGQK